MTSSQHQDWINHGKPNSGLALPLQLLANTLSAAGYTVYTYPNDAHLDAEPPEDHTYYSETGWPGTSPKWWRHAIDIMPGPAGKLNLQTIGQNLFNARQSGQITWLKYMNWPSDGNLAHAVQDRWEPGHTRGSSSDAGHIHLSSVTGCEILDSSFNPLTSVVLTGATTPGGFLMALTDQQQTDAYDWLAGLMDEAGNPTTRSRFGWRAPKLAVLHDTVDAIKAAQTVQTAQVAALTTVVQTLSDHIAAGGGNVDVAAVLAGVDTRLAALKADELAAIAAAGQEARDAVGDLAEGGAAQVRADA